MESLRKRAVEEVIRSEKSYLRHLEIIQEFFMQPIEDRKLLPQGDFVTIFGDLKSIIQVLSHLNQYAHSKRILNYEGMRMKDKAQRLDANKGFSLNLLRK